jgi:hypothetical protein
MPNAARLTQARRACIARALEASELPAKMSSRARVTAAAADVRSALAALRSIDPQGGDTARLRAELQRRHDALARRLELLWSADRRRVVALVIAQAAIGRAAGHPVQPGAGDRVRPLSADPAADAAQS